MVLYLHDASVEMKIYLQICVLVLFSNHVLASALSITLAVSKMIDTIMLQILKKNMQPRSADENWDNILEQRHDRSRLRV